MACSCDKNIISRLSQRSEEPTSQIYLNPNHLLQLKTTRYYRVEEYFKTANAIEDYKYVHVFCCGHVCEGSQAPFPQMESLVISFKHTIPCNTIIL